MKLFPLLLVLLLALFGASGARAQNCVNQSVCATLPAGYLITSGSQIQDGSGNNVRMACTYYLGNLGGSTAIGTDMQAIRNAGFNCIKRPWWDAMLSQASGVCCSSLADLDLEVTAAHTNHLKVVFSHIGNEVGVAGSLCRTVQQNGVWFDSGGTTNNTDGCGVTGTIPYATFKTNTVSLATRYNPDVTVIGFELHNQPLVRGVGLSANVNWGGGGASDVKAMCADVGAAVHAANSGVLIICPGPANPGTLFGTQAASVPVVQTRVQNPGQSFADSFGNVWKVTPGGQISFNGTIDGTTSVVAKLALVGTTLQQENGAGQWFSKAVVASPVAGGWAGPSSTSPLPNGLADRVYDFVSILGVVTHFQDPTFNGFTLTAALYEQGLDYLGFRVVRSHMGDTAFVPTLHADRPALRGVVAQNGFGNGQTSYLGNWPSAYASEISQVGAGFIFNSTGDNELNCFGQWPGGPSVAATSAQQQVAAVAANSSLNNIVPTSFASFGGGCPVSAGWGSGSNMPDLVADATNTGNNGVNMSQMHAYTGHQPIGDPAAPSQFGPQDQLQMTQIMAPNMPFLDTEWGYGFPGSTNACCSATTRSGPMKSINHMFDDYLLGAAVSTYFDFFDVTGENFGLFQLNSPGTSVTPYPIATGFHNLTTILADAGGTAATFTPGALNFTLSNVGSGANLVRSLLFEKSNGKFELFLWNEPPVDSGAMVGPTDIFPTPTVVTVNVPSITSALRFDPGVGTTAQQTICSNNCAASFTVSVAGGPQIIEITP